jgi:hypothetical protein
MELFSCSAGAAAPTDDTLNAEKVELDWESARNQARAATISVKEVRHAMLNDQQRQADPDIQPANVVVTVPSPMPAAQRQEAPSQSTQVEVYPRSAGANDAPATDRGAQQLHARQEVVRQRRFSVGKSIDLCWYALGVLEVALGVRFFFELTAANSAAGFVKFILAITQPFSWPFNGIFPVPRDGNNILDLNIIIAMGVYAGIAWGITRLLAMTIEPPSVT